MMQRFWSWLAVNLGKHAILVTAVLAAFTILIGTGITRLEFATGQDSYLNSNDEVYKDNVQYQKLFGGEAMLSVITMDPGHTVDELGEGAGRRAAVFQNAAVADDELRRPAGSSGVCTAFHTNPGLVPINPPPSW